MSCSPYRYSEVELHQIARRLEAESSPQRQELGRRLRLVADALSEVAKVDEGRGTVKEERECINRALKVEVAA